MDSLAQYVPQLLALLGTLAVAGLGFYQWRKQSSNQSRVAIAESRRKAAEALWTKLEEVNLALREASALDRARFRELERDVNKLFLKNSLYLQDSTQKLTSQYARAMFQVSELLTASETASALEWVNTAIGFSGADTPEVKQALDEANRLRAEVKNALLQAAGA